MIKSNANQARKITGREKTPVFARAPFAARSKSTIPGVSIIIYISDRDPKFRSCRFLCFAAFHSQHQHQRDDHEDGRNQHNVVIVSAGQLDNPAIDVWSDNG